MSHVRFIRSTHETGRFRPFPPEAMQFWREYGAAFGDVLRPETPLTFAEIVAACNEAVAESDRPVNGAPFLTEAHIAWRLVRLLAFDMARIVTGPIDPPTLPAMAGREMSGHVSVALVDLFSRRRLDEVLLPAVPSQGAVIYWQDRAYEVVRQEWDLAGAGEIVLVVRPALAETGRYPSGWFIKQSD